MATTIRDTDGHPVTLDLTKQGRDALWEVRLVRGTGLAKQTVYIGRLMGGSAAGTDWHSEYGFGWTSFPTRKQALLSLINFAEK